MHASLLLSCLLASARTSWPQTVAVLPAGPAAGVPGAVGAAGMGPVSAPVGFPLSPKDMSLRCDLAEQRFLAVVKTVAAVPQGLRTFENTVRPLQHAYGDYDEAVAPLSFMGSVSPDPAVREAAGEVARRSNDLMTGFYGRRDVYEAFREVAARGEPLEAEDKRLLEKFMQDYDRMGMDLPEERRIRVAEIERSLFELSRRFQSNLQEGTETIEAEPSSLRGLPGFFVDSLDRSPSGRLRIRLDYPSYTTVMRGAADDALRRRMELGYNRRAAEKNVPILEEILGLRRELAGILGYPSFAHYAMADSMAGTPERVLSFLRRLKTLLLGPAMRQSAALLEEKRRAQPSASDLHGWEISYYAAKLRKRLHGYDPEEVRSYFPADTVVKGMLEVFQEMLGLEFRELRARAYHPDVRLFEAVDKATGKVLGSFYLDLYARPGKDPGASAAYPLVSGRELPGGGYRDPVSVLAASFFKSSPERPPLLLHGEVEILFHEFGHLMHMTLGRRRHPQFSGANVARDFVEVPSQLMENLAWRPEVLQRISDRPFPPALLAKMLASRNVDSALVALKDVALSALDLAYHTAQGPIDTTALLLRAYADFGLSPPAPGMRFQATFEHIVDGYEAGYYGYPWSRSFAQDAFSLFERGGALDLGAGLRLRRSVLEAGSARDEADSLRDFLGREPDERAFLRYLGVSVSEVPVEGLLQDSDVLLLGENHYNASSVRWLAKNLGRLKAAGVTSIGLESLELPYEDAVNEFLAGKTQALPEEALQMPPGREADMRRLYEGMREKGLRVVALQKPFEEWARYIYVRAAANGVSLRERLPELWRIVEPAARANGIRDEDLGRLSAVDILKWFMMFGAQDHYVKGLNEAIAEVAFEVRNRFMAERLAAALGAGGKAAVLAGYGHLEHAEGVGPKTMFMVPLSGFGSLARELQGARKRSFSLTLTGGSFLDPGYAQRDREHKSAEYALVAEASPGGEPVFVMSSDRTGVFHMGGPVMDLASLAEPDPRAQQLGRRAAELAKAALGAFHKPVSPSALLDAALKALAEAAGMGAPAAAELDPDRRKALEALESRVAAFASEALPRAKDPDGLVPAMLKGMVAALGDPYAMLVEAKDAQARAARGKAGFAGIGATVSADAERGFMTLRKVLPASPAEEAGLREGDRVVAVDGRPLKPGMTAEERGLLGEEGTPVELGVERGEESFSVRLLRRHVASPTSFAKLLPDGVGYLYIGSFNSEDPEEASRLLSGLIRDGARSLVLDLRFNPGGDPKAARRLASHFLEKGKTVYSVVSHFAGKDGSSVRKEFPFAAEDEGWRTDLPLVVLVNGRSASASEILAAAVQEHARALVVGSRTVGKGSTQSLVELTEGLAVYLTVALWRTPGGRSVSEGGVAPDPGQEVSTTEAEDGLLAKKLRSELLGLPLDGEQVQDRALERAVELLRAQAASGV